MPVPPSPDSDPAAPWPPAAASAPPTDGARWRPDHPAVHAERSRDGDGDGDLRTTLLRHPSRPFVREVDALDERSLFAVADAYLDAALPALAAGARSLAAVVVGPAPWRLAWLPGLDRSARAPAGASRPGSFFVDDHRPGGAPDRNVVLLAGLVTGTARRPLVLGGQIGLRVIAHATGMSDGRWQVRVTGVTAQGLSRLASTPRLPRSLQLHRRPAGRAGKRSGREAGEEAGEEAVQESGQESGTGPGERPRDEPPGLAAVLLRQASDALGLQETTITGIAPCGRTRTDDAAFLVVHGTGRRTLAGREAVVGWSGRVRPRGGTSGWLETTQVAEQAAAATVGVFGPDPASVAGTTAAADLAARAPNRRDAVLDAFRAPSAVPKGRLRRKGLFEVCGRTVGPGAARPQAPQHAPAGDVPLRSDALGAVHAWRRGHELFERFTAYGIDPRAYFRWAALPLRLTQRAVLPDAPSGDGVNARVRVLGVSPDILQPPAGQPLPQLEVQFGAAAWAHRRADAAGRAAEPLGLAADPRWAWHEFGHVLIFASTAQLEFAFAHSAGDALAALVAAPDSALDADPALAGLTFPWSMLTRRHDRGADRGWCWCGAGNRLRLASAATRLPRPYAGYAEEQILSSSLYRAYRSLGGATCAAADASDAGRARAQRRRASDYLVYLLMQGIRSLGSAAIVGARSADEFLTALMLVDAGTGDWLIDAPWPAGGPLRRVRRRGGSAHKVLRWAFERQGLYAAPDAVPPLVVEGPGRPPAVDLHVPGRGARAAGGYDPVPLRWGSPDWLAGHGAVTWSGGTLDVQVCNRGTQGSGAGTLRAWAAPRRSAALAWTALGTAPVPPIGGDGLTTVHVTPAAGAPALRGELWILVDVSCAEDPANSDAATLLPCAAGWPATRRWALMDMVAGDNNIALAVLDFG